jgi:ATP-dependent RNA helicase DeaD
VENYVHRIGRTGRAGRAGRAFTFVAAREQYRLREIMRYTRARITESRLPTLRDVAALKTGRLLEEVRAVMEAGALERYAALVEDFLEGDATSMGMAAALLKILMLRELGPEESPEEKNDPDANAPSPRLVGGRAAPPPRDIRQEGKRGARVFAARRQSARVRLSFNVGRRLRVTPGDLVGAIAGETGIPGRSIGTVEIHDNLSFVDVPGKLADEIIEIMNTAQIRGFRVSVKRAAPGEGHPPRARGKDSTKIDF